MIYDWEFEADTRVKIATPAKQGQFSKAHTGPRIAQGFYSPYIYDYVTKLSRQQAEVKSSGEVYDRSSVQTAWGVICCDEPGLTETLYVLYIHKTCVTCKKNLTMYKYY
jgi:hypothetical protein